MTTETILDIVDRLGLLDLLVSKVRSRLEEVDFDELLDEVGDYLRRNPEVLVVTLATVTVSAGLIVYLHSRHEFEEAEEMATGNARATTSKPPAPRTRRA